jgi:rhodanese-related sulfurtransferase
MLHQNDRNIFIDTRIKRYYDYAHIPGAINIPYKQLDEIPPETLEKLKSSPNIVVYCISTSCGVSYRSARKLTEQGLRNVKIYTGGWGEWKSCKLPVASNQRSASQKPRRAKKEGTIQDRFYQRQGDRALPNAKGLSSKTKD